jgi:hypothetical protein
MMAVSAADSLPDDIELLKQLVRTREAELAAMPNIKLYPGMPATVMIPTIQRIAFDYIVGPLVTSFNHSFRQK